ncbi:MAG: nucleoside triphosphate pyrophosphohydrolase, partial [Schleiferiaceae bacterium]|nr:nucleoside triphosphate pyrophosphohydrolase [Schleiferiaceae bacterium]
EKVEEELKELRNPSSRENELMELGDVMFSLVNYAKHRGLDPEQALSLSNAKFLKRFQKMEEMLAKNKKSPIGVKIEEWNDLWDRAKKTYS